MGKGAVNCETCSGTGKVWRYVDEENGARYDHPPRLTELPCPDCSRGRIDESPPENFPMTPTKGRPN